MIRINMLQHLYIINKIWAAKTNKWFLQGNKDDAITLLNYSTVSLRSFDNHYRLTSGNEENLLSILPKDRENIEFGKIEKKNLELGLDISQRPVLVIVTIPSVIIIHILYKLVFPFLLL